jgi:hypothetical protein
MKKPIQIFKPGKHTAMSGVELGFSESDLAATAAAYDPAKHEAPIVIGHPKHDDPAYGWVKSLAFADGLEAEPHQVDQAFSEMVERGAFKKVSASFYAPDSPQNPVPGVYYLRHVGFLGAQPPAVKGLRAPEFADNEVGIVEFADWGDLQNANILRSLREWIISKFGLADADQAIPGYAVSAVEQDALTDDQDSTAGAGLPAQFTEKEGSQVTPEQKAALEAENARLKAEAAERDVRDKAAAGAARHSANVAFAEGLAKEGKLVPAQKGVAVAMLDFMGSQETVVEFGEGDAKKPLLDAFKEMLQAMPKQVEFSEVGGAADAAAAAASFDAPRGYSVDAQRLELHQKAVQYAEQNKCDYVTAVKAVEKI